MNPLITQVPHGAENERGCAEDFVDDVMESPNIRLEDDCDLARFEDPDDDEMGDVGCEDVQLRGVRADRGKLAKAPVAATGHPRLDHGHYADEPLQIDDVASPGRLAGRHQQAPESSRTTKRSDIFSTKSIKEKVRSRDRYKKCGAEYDENSRSSTHENVIESTNPLDRDSLENRHQAFAGNAVPADEGQPSQSQLLRQQQYLVSSRPQHVNKVNYNSNMVGGQQIFNNNNYVQNVNITVPPTMSNDAQRQVYNKLRDQRSDLKHPQQQFHHHNQQASAGQQAYHRPPGLQPDSGTLQPNAMSGNFKGKKRKLY